MSSSADSSNSAVKRTASLDRQGEKYTLVLWENGTPVQAKIVETKDEEIGGLIEWSNNKGVGFPGATYSMVTKGSWFVFEKKRYLVEEDTPFDYSPNVPPSKKLKTEMIRTSMDQLVESGTCYSIEECPKPVNPQVKQRPFLCHPGWLDGIKQEIQAQMIKQDESEDDRVKPMCLARCSRGGKTRSVYHVAQCFKSLVVSFNDITDLEEHEQKDPLAALTRRVAFAAYNGEKTRENFIERFLPLVVSDESVVRWLGKTDCVLFIDELNKLESIRDVSKGEGSLQTVKNFAKFLKQNFLVTSGRHFVFTTHESSVDRKLSRYLDSTGNRNIVTCALPLIPSLHEAQEAFEWKDLNAREAIYCGLVPGLILMESIDNFPTTKREDAVSTFLEAGFNEITVLQLLQSLVTGDRNLIPTPLHQLMDMSNGGKMRWIPNHMVYVLDRISKYDQEVNKGRKDIATDLRKHLQKICMLFGQFKDARTYGGDGWEALFGIVLLVRILTKQSDHLINIGSYMPVGDFITSFNEPINTSSQKQYDDLDNVRDFMDAVPTRVGGPRVAIYYPTHASFKKYDMFVVMWDANGNQLHTIGYQLKEGKEIPSDHGQRGMEIFVVRGRAAQASTQLGKWEVVSDAQVKGFFGDSGVYWTPKKWKEIRGS